MIHEISWQNFNLTACSSHYERDTPFRHVTCALPSELMLAINGSEHKLQQSWMKFEGDERNTLAVERHPHLQTPACK